MVIRTQIVFAIAELNTNVSLNTNAKEPEPGQAKPTELFSDQCLAEISDTEAESSLILCTILMSLYAIHTEVKE